MLFANLILLSHARYFEAYEIFICVPYIFLEHFRLRHLIMSVLATRSAVWDPCQLFRIASNKITITDTSP
jgi:hypothetical protein